MLKRFLHDDEEEQGGSFLTRVRKKPFQYLILLLCLINIALVIVNAGLWVMAAYQQLFVAADFTSFYTGYYMVRAGEGVNLYDPVLQSMYQQEFMGGLTFEGGVLLFPNPPYVAIAFAPLSLLRLDAAFYLWSFIQVAVLVWVFYCLIRLFSDWEKHERIIMVITILAYWPLTYTFLLGQFSLILLLGFVQMYIAMRNSKFVQAGLWMFLLAIKPHSLLIPGMMTLNKRYWRVAATVGVTGIIVFIATSLSIGLNPWLAYIQSLRAIGSYFGEYGVNPNSEFTIRGVLSNILGNTRGDATNLISLVVLLLGMGVVWFLWKKGIHQNSSEFGLYFAFAVLLSVFLSLHLNPHDSLVLVFPAALFYEYLRVNDHPRKAYSVLLLLSPMLFIFTSFSDFNFLGIIRLPVIIELVMLRGWEIHIKRCEFEPKATLNNANQG
jgi:hypothetical protein